MPRKKYDALDYQIIAELSQDARASAKTIADTIGANERTVRRRIEQLVDMGAVRFSAIFEPSAFGYTSIADINLAVDKGIYNEFVEKLKNNPNISYIATGWGEANLSIETRFRDNEEMYDYIERYLPSLDGINVLNFFIIPKILYNIDQWHPQGID